VIERIIENWLDKSTEKSFQKPFCYMLANQGFTVIHLSRHCGMELGKDILAIAPDGTPCAFQLKGATNGKISLRQWRNEISGQVVDLVMGQIVHPSLKNGTPHRSFLVTNGELEEEVMRAIDDMNNRWQAGGNAHYRLETFVRGQILQMAINLQENLWPSELKDFKTLLELFLEDGKGPLPKDKLASLFESIFQLDSENIPSRAKCERLVSSAAILCSLSISSFTNQHNHLAEIEAWTIYIAYVFALAGKCNLPFRSIESEFNIAKKIIYNTLDNLYEELKGRTHLIEGNFLADQPIFRVRVTWLLAFLGIYDLWKRSEEVEDTEFYNFLTNFYTKYQGKMQLWGEAAIPQFLAFYWSYRKVDCTPKPDFLILHGLIETICKMNQPRSKIGLANPYYLTTDILPHLFGIADEPLKDSFAGKSYALEGLVHLFVRRNWKQQLKLIWPDITRIMISVFEPKLKWHFYRWINKEGIQKDIVPKPLQKWEELKKAAFESEGKCIPKNLKKHPVIVLLFLCVYPHRMNSQIIRWLHSELSRL